MPVARSHSMHQSASKKPLPQKLTDRQPLASSPIVNAMRANELQTNKNVHNLSISDCSCPICLEILIEPVVLPCKHELCLPCFKDMMDQTNFLCPMCRMRLSTWARSASKQNTLVDKERWSQIQRAFSVEIRNRVEGKTAMMLTEEIKNQKINNPESSSSTSSAHHIVSAQGEIKKEYEEYLKREQERIRLEKEREEQLSLQYIQEIIQQEQACTINDYLRNLAAERPTLAQQQLPPTVVSQQPEPVQPPVVQQQPQVAQQHQQQQPITPSYSSTVIQPFITPSIPQITAIANRTASNRLIKRVQSTLVATTSSPRETGSTSTSQQSSDSTDSVTPGYSLRPRASIKRTLDEVQNLRSNLLKNKNNTSQSSVGAARASTSDEIRQPKAKRTQRTSSSSLNASSMSNESVNSHANETIDIDSKQPVLPQGMSQLVRRKSVRATKK